MNLLTAALVLREYGSDFEAQQIRPTGNAGGFSGSEIWRCSMPAGDFCLKRWPESTQLTNLSSIHAVLRHVHGRGFVLVPLPVTNRNGSTITSFNRALWDLSPWLAGEPIL